MNGGKHLKNRKITVLTVITIMLAAVFFVSGGMVVTQLLREKRENDAFKALSSRVPSRSDLPSEALPSEPDGTGTETPGTDVADPSAPTEDDPGGAFVPGPTAAELYGDLFAENPDMIGWISVEGTKINYPVMHTPDDPEFYLRRAFDKSDSYSGTPFMDGQCFVGCGNYIIYGHHMKNGTMFGDLPNYESVDYWKEHPVIHFDTIDGYGDYQILAAFYSRVYNVSDQGVFRYYRYTDLTDEEVFNEFIRNVHAVELYDTGVEAVYGDQLLTLSTCSYNVNDGRFVVVAKKIGGD